MLATGGARRRRRGGRDHEAVVRRLPAHGVLVGGQARRALAPAWGILAPPGPV